MTLTDIQAQVTKTAAFDGASLDISGVTGDWTIKLQVSALTAAKKARFIFQDSVDAFSANIGGPAVSVKGAISEDADKVYSFKKQDFPSLRFGTASAVLRLALAEIDSAASVEYRSWLET